MEYNHTQCRECGCPLEPCTGRYFIDDECSYCDRKWNGKDISGLCGRMICTNSECARFSK